MPEKMVELTTSLSVADCVARFKQGIDEGRGIGSQIGGMYNKVRGATDLDYYTPERGDALDSATDDPHDFQIGVGIPRLNKQHAHGTNVHMTVWDRGTQRDVLLWSHFATFGIAHASGVLGKLQEVLSVSGHQPPPPVSTPPGHQPPPPVPPPPPSGATGTIEAGPASPDAPPSAPPPAAEEEDLTEVGQAALHYALQCSVLMDSLQAALAVANDANGARTVAAQRPQQPTSIQTFERHAEKAEREFIPLIKNFISARGSAKDAALQLRQLCTKHDPPLDPELSLLVSAGERYGPTGAAIHVLRAEYGTTPYTFLEGLQVSNQAIQADIFSYGEDGFQGHVYLDPEATQQRPEPAPEPQPTAPNQQSPAPRRFTTVQPAGWEEIRAGLLDAFGGVDNVEIRVADPAYVAFTLTDGATNRRQSVSAMYHQGINGPDWFRVQSGFARYSTEAAAHALDYVSKPENSSVGVSKHGDFLVLRWTAAIGTVPMNHVFTMLDTVAGLADELEGQISGQDEF